MPAEVGTGGQADKRFLRSATSNRAHGTIQQSPAPTKNATKPTPGHVPLVMLQCQHLFCLALDFVQQRVRLFQGNARNLETLDLQEVHIIRDTFTADICRQITWAILTDGRSFFNTVLV